MNKHSMSRIDNDLTIIEELERDAKDKRIKREKRIIGGMFKKHTRSVNITIEGTTYNAVLEHVSILQAHSDPIVEEHSMRPAVRVQAVIVLEDGEW